MIRTPMHLVWAGGEAVIIFFVLSGMVLALPYFADDARDDDDWLSYYPRRFVRLYFPVWGAIALALSVGWIFGRSPLPNGGWWINMTLNPVRPIEVIRDTLLYDKPGGVINALWSLKWEVIFSLLLPAYVVAGRLAARIPTSLIGAILIGTIGVGRVISDESLQYLPIFGLGVLVAARRTQLAERFDRLSAAQWALFAGAAMLALLSPWLLPSNSPLNIGSVTSMLTASGAFAIVMLSWRNTSAIRLLENRASMWLGSRSYSLYLVHLPVIAAFAMTTDGWVVQLVPAVIGVSLLSAEAFYRSVERPSMHLARRVGGRSDSKQVARTSPAN